MNEELSIDDSGCYEDSNPCKKRKVLLSEDAVDDDITESEDKKSIPQVVKPAKIPKQPLPDPFPLPRHFTSEVELVLSSHKMTRDKLSISVRNCSSNVILQEVSLKRGVYKGSCGYYSNLPIHEAPKWLPNCKYILTEVCKLIFP